LDSGCDGLLVLDTETRHLSAQQASEQTERAAAFGQRREAKLIYKKTDSTLRGNIAAELRALRMLHPNRRIIYAPAYPDLGRTVKDGRLYVQGKPLHETEFAADRLNPVHDCRVKSVIGDADVLILDGDCNADISAAAALVLAEAPCICAGPSALAEALAAKLGSESFNLPELPRLPRCLVVNGSLHPASIGQIAWARNNGVFTGGWKELDDAVEGTGLARARLLGDRVRRELKREAFDAVVVFGGDTAFGLHAALGFAPFAAIGEIAPGLPISRANGLFWITKAGGYGDTKVLASLKQAFT
jgi:uncharacterized protein YgbK (DUF1537 family)